MAAEALDAVDVSWHGLAGDRRWAFVRQGVERSGFPWLTLRERPNMAHYRPSFADRERPDQSPTIVRSPDDVEREVTDPALAAELGNGVGGARVIKQDRGVFDTFPLSLITTETIGALEGMVGTALHVLRFRPNFLVQPEARAPFAEDSWVGAVLRIGGLRMRVDKRDGRCKVITIDPRTTQSNPEVLRVVAHERQGCLGVYGSTVEPGRVALGDPVLVESSG
jgi:uncharacterized protein YcbX